MADPRTFTVKHCQPAYAANSTVAIATASTVRRNFTDAVAKIGNLEVLNSVGAGKVGQGLRTLASVSNAIRTGSGSLPNSISDSADAGTAWVLENVGVNNGMLEGVRAFNPSAANIALGQAKQIYEDIKQGRFKITDIPYVIQDMTNLVQLGSQIFTPSTTDVQSSLGDRCSASPYAMDLINRPPKFKFLFLVKFIPNWSYSTLTNGLDLRPLDMTFGVKTSNRPTIKFQTENINYYNYRTSVVTRTDYQDISMTFYDDDLNLATRFYRAYLNALSPISNMNYGMDPTLLETTGMDIQGHVLSQPLIENSIPASAYAASRGLLAGDVKNVFAEIQLYEIHGVGNSMNVYRFFNPTINTLSPDDLDMSQGSDGLQLSLTFSYDGLYVDTDVSMADNTQYRIDEIQKNAMYPLRYNGEAGATTGTPLGNNIGTNPYVPNVNPLNTIDTSISGMTNISDVKGIIGDAIGNPFSILKNL